MEYAATTSTVEPLLTKPRGVRTLPKAFDGFTRDSTCSSLDGAVSGRTFDAKQAAFNTANSGLQKNLKGRHLQMIAIGGSIGE